MRDVTLCAVVTYIHKRLLNQDDRDANDFSTVLANVPDYNVKKIAY